MISVYAIRSQKSNRIYIGQTQDINERLTYHNSGYVKSTESNRPWEVIAIEQFESRNKARWKERKLKESKGARLRWIHQNHVE